MRRSASVRTTVLLAALTLACEGGAPATDDAAGMDAAASASDAVPAGAQPGDPAGSDSAANGHGSPADQDTLPVPDRSQETVRDAGEKPERVMDELGIGPGSHVADVMAGGGYYTWWLAKRVGPSGRVYATEAEGLVRRLERGDLEGVSNVKVPGNLAEVPAGTLDAVIINRGYHLFNQPQTRILPLIMAALKPGGRLGIVEVRLGMPTGHDMRTHRMGQRTVREEVEAAGFRFAGASELLANPEDPRDDFMEGRRHLADRMFLKFTKPAATAGR
ncbi:MAG: class I SAM-dependent methyltransferase [Gemmatimonadetes bacterium]|nr:class I SAM-dependent methyltransferase [Gemmatimonadota bacterium]